MSRTSHEALRNPAFQVDLKTATNDELYSLATDASEGELEDERFASAVQAWRKLGANVLKELELRGLSWLESM
jgi:hypothetical protein